MSTMTARTHLGAIDLGEMHDGMIGLSIVNGRAPVLVVSYPGGSAEFPVGTALTAGLVSAVNHCDLLTLQDRVDSLSGRPDTLPGLDLDNPRTVRELAVRLARAQGSSPPCALPSGA